MSTSSISNLGGAALYAAFVEACIAHKVDPALCYDWFLHGAFGMTAAELAGEHGPDWYQVADDLTQDLHDAGLRGLIRHLESLALSLGGDICELALHQVMAQREQEEQVRSLFGLYSDGGGDGGDDEREARR